MICDSSKRRRHTLCTAFCLLVLGLPGQLQAAIAPLPGKVPAAPSSQTVLDIENLRAVTADRFPIDEPTCQVLVIGGGLGGVAAAEDLADAGVSVILTETTSHLGGQLTAQGLSTPDENKYIEQVPGPGTRHYLALREQVRAFYAAAPGIRPGMAQNVGQCWVSRISAEPSVWEQAIDDRLAPLITAGGIRRILRRYELLDIRHYPGNGRISYADLIDLDTGHRVRIGAQYVLDATETGDGLALAGSPWTIGQESQATYAEPDAPPIAHPEWVQSFTYSFDVRLAAPNTPLTLTKPNDYGAFRALGQYSLVYNTEGTNPVTYKVFARAPDTGGPFWTYRRLVAASSFAASTLSPADVSLINWSGNDYRQANWIGLPVPDQIRVLSQAKAFAQGFLYWLQTECPRDDGTGLGYPEIQAAGNELGGDGFAPYPYLRESRRLLAQTTLTENDMTPPLSDPSATIGADFFDAVGIALYAIDIHPAQDEPPLLKATLPYELPLGAFLPRSGPSNIIPAATDFGASRLAMASARVHPVEWLSGEIAGHLAAFCLSRNVEPAQVRATPTLLAAFQAQLEDDGITTRWSEVVPFNGNFAGSHGGL